VAADCLAVDALARMRAQEITCLMILEKDGSPRGVVRLADLVREGIVEAAGNS
jgi:predicted transcriptional regulator